MPYRGTSGGDSTLTGPCEAAYPNDDPEAKPTDALLLKCGRPGTLRKQWLLPWGTMLCDTCEAKMQMRALRSEQEKRGHTD